jgi:hypothetical protein
LQKWHLYKNTQFNSDGSLRQSPDINPPSTNPWARHIDLLLPAVNISKDTALGCLLGESPELFGGSRRALINITSVLFHHVRFFLGNVAVSHNLNNWNIFQEFFGLRVSEIKHSAFSSSAVAVKKHGGPFMTQQPKLAQSISTASGRRYPTSLRMK